LDQRPLFSLPLLVTSSVNAHLSPVPQGTQSPSILVPNPLDLNIVFLGTGMPRIDRASPLIQSQVISREDPEFCPSFQIRNAASVRTSCELRGTIKQGLTRDTALNRNTSTRAITRRLDHSINPYHITSKWSICLKAKVAQAIGDENEYQVYVRPAPEIRVRSRKPKLKSQNPKSPKKNRKPIPYDRPHEQDYRTRLCEQNNNLMNRIKLLPSPVRRTLGDSAIGNPNLTLPELLTDHPSLNISLVIGAFYSRSGSCSMPCTLTHFRKLPYKHTSDTPTPGVGVYAIYATMSFHSLTFS